MEMSYVKEVAIIGIVVIASVALYSGVNGVLLASAIAGIAGIAGYDLGRKAGESSQPRVESPSPEADESPPPA